MATLQNFDAEIARTKRVVEDMRSRIEQSGVVLEKFAQTDAKIGPLLTKAFALTLETARGIGKPLPQAVVDPASRPRVEKLATQIQAMRQLVGTRLAAALNLSVGFNALDGD